MLAGSPPVFELEPSAELAKQHGYAAQSRLAVSWFLSTTTALHSQQRGYEQLQYIATLYGTTVDCTQCRRFAVIRYSCAVSRRVIVMRLTPSL